MQVNFDWKNLLARTSHRSRHQLQRSQAVRGEKNRLQSYSKHISRLIIYLFKKGTLVLVLLSGENEMYPTAPVTVIGMRTRIGIKQTVRHERFSNRGCWGVSCPGATVSRSACCRKRVRSRCPGESGSLPPVDSQDPAMISRKPAMVAAVSGSLSRVTPRRTDTAGLT